MTENKGCPECIEGFVHSIEEGRTFVYRCASCMPEQPESYPFQSSRYLKAQWKLHPVHEWGERSMTEEEGMQAIKAMSGNFELPF